MKKQRILVLLPNWIGDAVMATPTLRALRKLCPEEEITLGGLPFITDIFRSTPYADDLLPISKPQKSGIVKKIAELRNQVASITSGNFDTVFLLRGSFSSASAAWLASVPKRLGYAREGRGFLLTHSMAHPDSFRKRHRVRYFLDLLALVSEKAKELGEEATTQENPLEVTVDNKAKSWASEFLSAKDVCGPMLCLHLGAAYGPSKRWPVSKILSTLKLLTKELHPYTALVVGGNEEREAAKHLQEELGPLGINVIEAAGETPGILELAALIERSDLLLSNDSGPMHVGAALSKKQVAIFTSTNPNFTKPWNEKATVLSAEIDCSPCFKRGCERDFPCHEAISPEEVKEAILNILGD